MFTDAETGANAPNDDFLVCEDVLKTDKGGLLVGEIFVKLGRAGGGRLTLFFKEPLGGGGILSCSEAFLEGEGLEVVGGLNLKFCC